MGVPDLLGGYGRYQYFSSDTMRSLEEPGGYRKPLIFQENSAKGNLIGPENTALKKPAKSSVPATRRNPGRTFPSITPAGCFTVASAAGSSTPARTAAKRSASRSGRAR